MNIITRSAWGARAWRSTPYSVALSSRRYFLVHYHGGEPRNDRGKAMAKEIEGIHLANGWSGIGYNFMVAQDGTIYEGRGWGLAGAHCPGRNTDGIGVYVAVGGNQEPTEAAKRSVRWLYDEACRKTGRSLSRSWHGAHYPTACCGGPLIAWVKAGMKVSGGLPAGGTVVEKAPARGWTKADVARFQRSISTDNHPIEDDGVWGEATERQAQAARNYLAKRDGISDFDKSRGWHLAQEFDGQGLAERFYNAVRRVQWSLFVVADGEWGPKTDAAWVDLRRAAYKDAHGHTGLSK